MCNIRKNFKRKLVFKVIIDIVDCLIYIMKRLRASGYRFIRQIVSAQARHLYQRRQKLDFHHRFILRQAISKFLFNFMQKTADNLRSPLICGKLGRQAAAAAEKDAHKINI